MGNSTNAATPADNLALHNINVKVQVTTVYNESEALVEARAWNSASLTLSNKVLTLCIHKPVQELLTMQVDETLDTVSEHLAERKVGLRRVCDRVLTFAQIQFPTMQSFLLWGLCFNKSRRPVWDVQTTTHCRVSATQLCGSRFTWVRRQHHCRNCGKAVCGGCSPRQAVLVKLGYSQAQRVCSLCAQLLEVTGSSRPRSDSYQKSPRFRKTTRGSTPASRSQTPPPVTSQV